MNSEAEGSSRAGGWGVALACWLVVGAGLVVSLDRIWGFTVDDAAITHRLARNLASGLGFVYNPGGPPVEASTSLLLLFLQVPAFWLHADVIAWTKILGSLGAAATLAGSWLLTRDLLRRAASGGTEPPVLVTFLGPAILAFSPMVTFGATAGLETTLFAGLLTLGAWLLLRVDAGEGGTFAAAVVLGLATWTRPEGIAWLAGLGIPLLVAAWKRGDSATSKRLAMLVAGGLGFWLAMELFRLVVFGRLQPNTYYVKMAGSTLGRVFPGLRYVREFMVSNLGLAWVGLGLGAAFLQSERTRRGALALLVCVFGQFLIVIMEGGDWIPHLRMLTPAMGVLMGLAGAGFALITARVGGAERGRSHAIATAMACLAVAAAWWTLRPAERKAFAEAQTRIFGWNDAHVPIGKWLGKWQEGRTRLLTVVVDDVGFIGWYGRTRILDLAGLTDPDWAMTTYQSDRQAPYPARELLHEVRPEVIILTSFSGHRADPLELIWMSNRDIYNQPDFHALYRERAMFTHKDFPGDGYFLHVFVRSDVWNECPEVVVPKARAVGGG